jgi:hypothetical protein
MAAIFQIRRGTTDISSSILDGELYLHKGKNSLQVSIGDGNPITLLALNTSSVGNINLTGNLSASNAYFSGDVAISGNLFLGNNQSDNISALGVFTTNLIPGTNNLYDVGNNSAKWSVVYANSLSGSLTGSVNGINITTFSESVDSRLDRLQDSTASLNSFSSSEESKNSTLATYTSSVNSRLDQLQLASASLQSFTSSQEAKDLAIASYTGSINTFTSSQEFKDIVIASYTGSMNTFTQSIYEHTSSINEYTHSLKTAIDVTGGNTRIIGNLIVDGTQTSLNTTNTYIEDKLLTLSSGSTTSLLSDGSGFEIAGANVSMSWEHTNTRFAINTNLSVVGSISSSTIVGLNGDSVTVYSTSVDSRLSNLQSTSASVSSSLSNLQLTSASVSSSLSNLQLTSASVNSRLDQLETNSGSQANQLTNLQLTSASVSSSLSNLELTSASVSSSLLNLQLTSASVSSSLSNLQLTSASVSSSLSNLQLTSASVSSSLSNLQLTSASVSSSLSQINSWTGSGFFNTFSTSVDSLLDGLRYDVDLLTPAGLSAAFDNLNAFTTSTNSRLNSIEAVTSSYETKGSGIVSGSSQITYTSISSIPAGIVSGSSQIFGGSGLVSGSSQVDITATTNYTTFSSSIASDVTSLNLYTSSLRGAITISGTDVSLAGNLTVLGTTTIIDSTVVNIKDNIIQLNGAGSSNAGLVVRDATGTLTSGSLLWDTTNDYWIAGPLGAESKLLRQNGDNVVSGSSQVLGGTGIVSGSSQITYASISSIPANIVSGSSQITYASISSIPGGIVSGSSQITPLLPTGTVSGSSQVLGGTTIHSGSSGDYQFNSIGVGTAASALAGEIRATNDITAYYSSDIRLKENIQPIQNALEKVESISGNTYDWKEGFDEIHSHKGNDIGVIAQEIEEILPQIVTNRDNGYKAVQYEKIVPLLIEAIKELSAKIKRLENK